MILKQKKDKIFLIILFVLAIGSFFILPVRAAPSNAKYLDLINESFNMSQAERDLLEKNQFVVLNRLATDDVLDAYIYYWEEDLPIMITSDMVLHLWHLFFDNRLEKLEQDYFYYILGDLILNMNNNMNNQFPLDEFPITEGYGIQDVRIYLTTALKLLDKSYNATLSEIEEISQNIYNLIMQDTPLATVMDSLTSPLEARFADDFSQYMPRGHYTHSEELKSYFRVFKWLARIPFYFDDYNTKVLMKREESEMFKSAFILSWLLQESTIKSVSYYGYSRQNDELFDGYEFYQIYNQFLDLVVGQSFSVTVADLLSEGDEWVQNWTIPLKSISNSTFENIRNAILVNESITSPVRTSIISFAMEDFGVDPKTFHFIGERLQLDTYLLNQMVNPYILGKIFPSGLEFAAIMMDSNHALKRLESPYEDRLIKLRASKVNWTEDADSSLTMEWYSALQEIAELEPQYPDNQTNYAIPQFMASPVWMDKQMTTLLGSWAQLKHDMILYIQQGYGTVSCSTPAGYVEPYPQLYSRLHEMVSGYHELLGLFDQYVRDSDISNGASTQFLSILNSLELIAKAELEQTSLTHDQKDFLQSVFFKKYDYYSGYYAGGWLTSLMKKLEYGYNALSHDPDSHVSLIADIHTDVHTAKVLEIATGLFEHIVAIVPGWNSQQMAVVGPVFSYYEFQVDIDSRMTDEMWRGIVYDKSREFNFRGKWAENYMASTKMPDSFLFEKEWNDLGYEPPGWYKNTANLTVKENYGTLNSDIALNIQIPIESINFHFSRGKFFARYFNQILAFSITIGMSAGYYALRRQNKELTLKLKDVKYLFNFTEDKYFAKRVVQEEVLSQRKPMKILVGFCQIIPLLGFILAILNIFLLRPKAAKRCAIWGWQCFGRLLLTLLIEGILIGISYFDLFSITGFLLPAIGLLLIFSLAIFLYNRRMKKELGNPNLIWD